MPFDASGCRQRLRFVFVDDAPMHIFVIDGSSCRSPKASATYHDMAAPHRKFKE